MGKGRQYGASPEDPFCGYVGYMSLLYGLTDAGERVHIRDYDPTMLVHSPLGRPLIAKRGTKKVHHFAHRYAGDRDEWLDPVMTDWHCGYQEVVDPTHVEVRIERDGVLHIADLRNRDDVVIELQHSPIIDEVIREREQFYGNMIWLFDYSHRLTTPTDVVASAGKILLETPHFVSIRLNSRPKPTTKPTFYDVGTEIYEYLGVGPDPKVVWCRRLTRASFLARFFAGILARDYVADPARTSRFFYDADCYMCDLPLHYDTGAGLLTVEDPDTYGLRDRLRGHFAWDRLAGRWGIRLHR